MSHHPFMREVRKSNNEGVLHGVGVELLGVFFGGVCRGSNFEKGPNPLSELDLLQKGAERERERERGSKVDLNKPQGRQDIT
jgi:hypothetical protein